MTTKSIKGINEKQVKSYAQGLHHLFEEAELA